MKLQTTGSALRKKLYSLLAISSLALTGLVALSTPASAASPSTLLTFESGDTGAAAMGTNDFEGATTSVVTPPTGGSTGSLKSAKISLASGAKPWAGALIATLPSGDNFTSALHKTVTMNVYSPKAGADVHIKLRVGLNDALSTEMNAASKTVVGWQTMTFNFDNVNLSKYAGWDSLKQYNYFFVFPDFTGNETTPVDKSVAEDFYIDDVAFNGATTPPINLLPASHIQPTGLNGLVNNDAGAADWASAYAPRLHYFDGFITQGSTFTLHWHVTNSAGLPLVSQAVTLLADKGWSGSNATFLSNAIAISYPGSGGANGGEITGMTDSNGDVSFTLTDTSSSAEPSTTSTTTVDANVSKVFGQFALQIGALNSATNESLDIVDIHIIEVGAAHLDPCSAGGLCTTFENAVDGDLTAFGGNSSTISSTPPAGGSVGSTKSAKIIKNAGQTWAGTTFLTAATSSSLLTDGNKTVTANVYSAAGKLVNLKLEDSTNGDLNVEATATTATDGWQTLTFTFANNSHIYNKASIFFDFNNAGASEIYYLDDVHFPAGVLVIAPGGGDAPATLVTFEPADTTPYFLGSFPPGIQKGDYGDSPATSSLENAPAGGSTGNTKAMKFIKGAPQWSGTTFLNFGGTSTTVVSAGKTTITMNVFAPSANKNIRLKAEKAGDPTISVETNSTTLTVPGWQTLTFNFLNQAPGTAAFSAANTYNMLSIMPDWQDGDLFTQGSIWYFDDVAFNGATTPAVTTPGSGGGSGGGSTHYNIKLISPVLTLDNSYNDTEHFYKGDFSGAQAIANGLSDKAYVYYTEVGSTLTLTYHVDNGEIGVTGDPVVGKVISLIVGKKYSNSNASFTNAPANPGDWPAGTAETVLTGTTNSEGNVTFVLVNTNATGSNPPTSANSAPGTLTGTVTKSNFYPTTGTGSGDTHGVNDAAMQNETIDNLWPYFYTPAGYTPPPVVPVVENPLAYKLVSSARATISSDLNTNKITCEAPTASGDATFAAFYLFVDHKLISGKRYGDFVGAPIYKQLDVPADSASLSSASWTIASKWNAGHIALINCVTYAGNSYGTAKSTSATAVLPRVGKYVRKSAANSGNPTDVTMRLVSPALVKDASGAPVDYIDFSSDPVKNHWDQYYGKADGGLGVFYKYFTAGSTITLKYHVTDSKTKKAVPFFNVWLIVNKNYGGNESATFTLTRNGVVYTVTPHSTDMGETQIAGITDDNGDVSFTLVNTNSASSAEAKPSALNVEQPKSVSSVFSTITLTAHLGTDETHETKDIIWAHIVKP